MSQTVRVRFTRPYTVKDADLTHYPKDSEHEFEPAAAAHFVSRNAAEVVTTEDSSSGGSKKSSSGSSKPSGKPKRSTGKKKDDDKPTGESSEGAGDSGTES